MDVTRSGNAHHQRGEQQRSNDRLNQAQKYRPEQPQFLGGPREQRPEGDARHQRDQYPGGH